jgi:hypothetical protein
LAISVYKKVYSSLVRGQRYLICGILGFFGDVLGLGFGYWAFKKIISYILIGDYGQRHRKKYNDKFFYINLFHQG